MKTLFDYYDAGVHDKGLYAPNSNTALLDEQNDDRYRAEKASQRFLLDVSKRQSLYDSRFESDDYAIGDKVIGFDIPFDHSFFAFKNPLQINWSDKEGNKIYQGIPLLGFLIYKKEKRKGFDEGLFIDSYKVFLYFDEGDYEENKMVGTQYVLFNYAMGKKGPRVFHIDHYPCIDKIHCCINKNGIPEIDEQKSFACQEILCRDSLVDTLMDIIMKVNTTEPIYIKKKIDKKKPSWLSLPFGWPYTKGNLPKDNYIYYLDGKRYVYDKDDIDYGSGTKHRYRYDVRRHPRVVGDRIVWVQPHTRGAGKYIKKTYANSKGWAVQYLYYYAEKLTKIRSFEIILARLITFIKKSL